MSESVPWTTSPIGTDPKTFRGSLYFVFGFTAGIYTQAAGFSHLLELKAVCLGYYVCATTVRRG